MEPGKLPEHYMLSFIFTDQNSHSYYSFTVDHGNVKDSKLYLSSNDVTLLPNKPNWLFNNIAVHKVSEEYDEHKNWKKEN